MSAAWGYPRGRNGESRLAMVIGLFALAISVQALGIWMIEAESQRPPQMITWRDACVARVLGVEVEEVAEAADIALDLGASRADLVEISESCGGSAISGLRDLDGLRAK